MTTWGQEEGSTTDGCVRSLTSDRLSIRNLVTFHGFCDVRQLPKSISGNDEVQSICDWDLIKFPGNYFGDRLWHLNLNRM